MTHDRRRMPDAVEIVLQWLLKNLDTAHHRGLSPIVVVLDYWLIIGALASGAAVILSCLVIKGDLWYRADHRGEFHEWSCFTPLQFLLLRLAADAQWICRLDSCVLLASNSWTAIIHLFRAFNNYIERLWVDWGYDASVRFVCLLRDTNGSFLILDPIWMRLFNHIFYKAASILH